MSVPDGTHIIEDGSWIINKDGNTVTDAVFQSEDGQRYTIDEDELATSHMQNRLLGKLETQREKDLAKW